MDLLTTTELTLLRSADSVLLRVTLINGLGHHITTGLLGTNSTTANNLNLNQHLRAVHDKSNKALTLTGEKGLLVREIKDATDLLPQDIVVGGHGLRQAKPPHPLLATTQVQVHLEVHTVLQYNLCCCSTDCRDTII
ncbi:hypothetical protein E2C01_002725 [Portunus trituberculatus]|uniref:Uncharacterized protein n=1 Tax=Portunus trituberculatus TaxID=210409 RepID=A0A5B7CKI0_PORTR|nr:hypothetical protein [Portunus trituberculatus]